jgi:hypothetical protein
MKVTSKICNQQQNILQFSYTELFSSIKLFDLSSRCGLFFFIFSFLSLSPSLSRFLVVHRHHWSSLLIFNWFQILLAKGVRTSLYYITLIVDHIACVSWVEFINFFLTSSRLLKRDLFNILKIQVVCHTNDTQGNQFSSSFESIKWLNSKLNSPNIYDNFTHNFCFC